MAQRLSWKGLSNAVAVRARFGRGDVVHLWHIGDGALLVLDARQFAVINLCFVDTEGLPHLLLRPCSPQSFSVRLNNVVYDSGPVEVVVGDEIGLILAGTHCGMEERVFLVESAIKGHINDPQMKPGGVKSGDFMLSYTSNSQRNFDWLISLKHQSVVAERFVQSRVRDLQYITKVPA
ncbi:hypothetical protein ERJ75_001410500 [Trypanosoma vivax]|uniref:Uncharacterized protein n=1 Tax=Trypanosoma vivax (strain Y486) TaxID=1055687 RepID=G0TU94_TRYVY|nr:hypothetical protein TRVL_01043 [Trypanosoma vivax]KAH8607360.1 hypothetical protein ERJ75_001410500 [Trypanosoma vivax]CCC47528.1 conserved hypothetical protein [Trypanosoma vivax Y486]